MNSFVRYVILGAVTLTAISIFTSAPLRALDKPVASQIVPVESVLAD